MADPSNTSDDREQRAVDEVIASARPGSIDDALRVLDDFGWHQSMLINVGDRKGLILDDAVRAANPRQALELGAYVGYSALRIARLLAPGGRLVSVELNPTHAALTRRVLAHAGVDDRVTVVVGAIGDGGKTVARLSDELGFSRSTLDLLFLDHAKDAYLSDLRRILNRGWLHSGSVVVADNVVYPGAPDYHAYMKANEGARWRSVEYQTVIEYQTEIEDLVVVSEYLGDPAP